MLPTWVLGAFGTLMILLLTVIGFLTKFVMGTFKTVVERLERSLAEFVKSFQDFKESAPREYVTHPFLEMVRENLEAGIAHNRQQIEDHKKDCPLRANAMKREG